VESQQMTNINIDDAVVVQQCKNGDQKAMEWLILKYQNRIYNIILKMCGNQDDAAELTQDTFVKIIENIDRFQSRSSFYTWAFRIAVNLTINYCKRSKKIAFSSLDAEDNKGQKPKRILKEMLRDKKSLDPAVIAQNKELCGLIKKSLMQLDEDHRAAIILRDIAGMTYADIAEVLELELGTVKSRISRARCSLRDIFEGISK